MGEDVCPILIGHNYVRTIKLLRHVDRDSIEEALNRMITEEEEKGAELENVTAASSKDFIIYILTFFKPHPPQEEKP